MLNILLVYQPILSLERDHSVYQCKKQHFKIVSFSNVLFIIYLSDFMFTGPSGYPSQLVVTMESPNQVVLQWDPVPEMEQNGVITHHEVVYTQNSIGHLPQSGTESVSEMMATVGPLQPFILYNLTVRAFTSIGAGPFNPVPITVMMDPSGINCY